MPFDDRWGGRYFESDTDYTETSGWQLLIHRRFTMFTTNILREQPQPPISIEGKH